MAMNNSLAEVHPELITEWSEKNLPLTPDDITFGSNKKVWWKGTCGHEWQTSVKARSNGEKCPICSGARVIAGINDLATLEPLLAKQWSKKNKIKPTEVSIGSHKKVIWRCKKGHEWEAAVKSRTINKTGCPYCSHNKVLAGFNDLATLLPDIAAEWSDRNYPLLPTQVTVFANRKAWWKCKDCGREWNTLISTRSGGSKCPYCSGYIFLKGFNDLQTTHPEIASEWSEKNLPLKPDEVNAKSRKNVWWKCRKCGNEWKSVVNARVKGTVCPVCAEREVLAGYKAGVGFINEAMRGTLKIVKTSSDGKVKGFAFRVTGANGYDMTFETDKNGEIVIEGLRIGEYTVSEVANNASAAYITPADQNVTIKLDETAVVKMHNELRDTPKTGDDTNMKLWYVLAGLSAVGIAVTSVVAHKKKKKEGNE